MSAHPRKTSASIGKIDLSLARRILALTVPVALTGQLDNLVGFADIYMVGQLGTAAISAVGISNQIIMVITIAMVAVTTGTMALVAQAVGAGNRESASAAAKQSFTLVALLSIGLSLLGMTAASTILEALSVKADVVHLGAPYLRVFFGGIMFMTLNFVVTTCLQGAGDTRTPLYIGLLINAIKLVASYVLIFGLWGFPKMGVTGAAAGTIVGRFGGLLVGLWVLYSGRFGLALLPNTTYRLDRLLARRILRIGIPSALQGLFRNGSNLIFIKLIALTSSSTTAVAAFSIGNQMERVLRRTSLAFGTAATALVGHSLGAGKPEEADQRGWTVLLIATATTLLLGLPVALFAHPFLGLFTTAPEVIQMGVVYLYAMVLAEPFMCAAIVSGGSLRGAGDTMPALYYTVIPQWLIRLPAAYVLAFVLGYDINGIWAALVIFSGLQGALTVWKFARGEWKTLSI
ncbi:MAG: MATE family efflux transporter [bacterium]|nr:MATE family efflux transporter [bacterium]